MSGQSADTAPPSLSPSPSTASATAAGREQETPVAVFGASGYSGAELLRVLSSHPFFRVVSVTAASHEGVAVADLFPSLATAYPDLVYSPNDAESARGADLAFCALPHGASQELVPELLSRVAHVIDLAADFRLKDAGLYPQWYGLPHTRPELLAEAVYGLPELDRGRLRGARLVAAAGCYVTAAVLAIAPLVTAGLVEPRVVVDAASGASGAGRKLTDSMHFCSLDEDFTAYSLVSHRHTPEMEQALGAQVLFTPHLAPMSRGILATCYARPMPGRDDDPLVALEKAYAAEPFVLVAPRSPSTKATLGSNAAHVTARRDRRTDWVISICALDNLMKGASGQAVQCANAVMGWPETTGLPVSGLFP